MTYFVSRKLAYAAACINVRAEYLEQAQAATSENIYSLERIIKSALPLAEAQLHSFANHVGEPLPPHLRAAFVMEIEFWRTLEASLAMYRESDPTEADARVYTRNVQQFLGIHLDLVRMTEELVHSCLVDHYLTMTRALRAAAEEVPL